MSKATTKAQSSPLTSKALAGAALAAAGMIAVWGAHAGAEEAPKITCDFTSAGITLYGENTFLNLPDVESWKVEPLDRNNVVFSVSGGKVKALMRGTLADVRAAIANCAYLDITPGGAE